MILHYVIWWLWLIDIYCISTILPPLLLTLRRWQHWWWEAPCPCSYRVAPIVHPGSLQRNHRLIYFPCLYFINCSQPRPSVCPAIVLSSSLSPTSNTWVSNCSAWLTSLSSCAEVSWQKDHLFLTRIPGKSTVNCCQLN